MNPPKHHLRNSIIIFVINSFALGIIFQEIVTHLLPYIMVVMGFKNYDTYFYQVQHGGDFFSGNE